MSSVQFQQVECTIGLGFEMDRIYEIIGEAAIGIFIQAAVPGSNPDIPVFIFQEIRDIDLSAAGMHGWLKEAVAVIPVHPVVGAYPEDAPGIPEDGADTIGVESFAGCIVPDGKQLSVGGRRGDERKEEDQDKKKNGLPDGDREIRK